MRPAMELKRFQRLTLKPDESRTVTFNLEKDAFALYDPETNDWVVEPGTFEIMVGSSSRDIRTSEKLNL